MNKVHLVMNKLRKLSLLAAVFALLVLFSSITPAQTKKVVRIFLDVRETNLEKPSTVAINTISERLSSSGFRVTTNKREAALIVDGTISSRSTPVTDEVKQQGGVNADATASVRLLVGTDVIATSVERTGPGDWGVQPERVGEDRLIEVAGRIADDLFATDFLPEILGSLAPAPAQPRPTSKAPSKPKAAKKPRRGVSFLEVASLVQNSAPEERIVAALKKYGIKFKPLDGALNQLRGLGASEALISTVKSSNVLV